eukprot:gnl/TRDRNA2_/TRDRNA2_196530_c0_seq1.p1 gnl/TRDRNA2_/TRDRNA2_196530_c0~~gnl/TRDRNA2_/TRDRNA2_196530_c0_seq1.p1  ORF type:complete len:225 (-),score=15.52 gnl/TRDRNA2_/TRDRNA2_196530_c0_seq1:83-757(-)
MAVVISPSYFQEVEPLWASIENARMPQVQELEAAVEAIFGSDNRISGLTFSLTIADPKLPGCPLIGCSAGFRTLTGYDMQEIVGRNCRFLVDPVPDELVDTEVRRRASEFCMAVREGKDYRIPKSEWEQWMPTGTPGELFCIQINARKDGTLFNNMFYLRSVHLDDHPYIIGLQAEVPEGHQVRSDPQTCCKVCSQLNKNMTAVEQILANQFWYSTPLRRQESE